MPLVQTVISIDGKTEVNELREWKFTSDKTLLKDNVLRLEVTMADLSRMHVVKGKQQLIDDICTIRLL